MSLDAGMDHAIARDPTASLCLADTGGQAGLGRDCGPWVVPHGDGGHVVCVGEGCHKEEECGGKEVFQEGWEYMEGIFLVRSCRSGAYGPS